MNTYRGTAILIGILYIIGTVTSLINVILLEPILEESNYLTEIAENQNTVITAVILEIIMAIALLGISVLIFPILKQHENRIAIGYVVSRSIEVLIILVGHISLLALVSLSKGYEEAGSPSDSSFRTVGEMLVSIGDWTHILGPMLAFGITALILNYSLYKSKVVPRFLSLWGFIGGILIIIAAVWGMLGLDPFSTTAIIMFFPIALNEMILALWLIFKGFNSSTID